MMFPRASHNLTSLTVIPELSLHLASFLTPTDSFNLLLTCKGVLSYGSGSDGDKDRHTYSSFMHVSLKQSLLSIIRQRPEFASIDVASFIEGIRTVAEQNVGGGQVLIAGSLIVQAITNRDNASPNSGFSAEDIDIFSTAKTLPIVRQLLVDFGFVLTGVSTTYGALNDNKIHHVESYSLAPVQTHATTVAEGIRSKYLRRAEKFLMCKTSPYAMNPNFPFSSELHPKHIDVVVSSAATVNDTIRHFDVEMCKSSYDGAAFSIPNLGQILRSEARLACPKWAALVNSYASLFLSHFKNFWRIPLIVPFPAFSPIDRRVDYARKCFQIIRDQGNIYFPDRDGIFRPPSEAPILSAIYVVTLHNMVVKICQRIIKYTRRGFDFPDITIGAFKRKHKRENTRQDSAPADEDVPVSRCRGEARCARTKHRSRCTNLAKRVKLLHRDDVSSPVFRAKMRLLDKDGINTTPLYRL